MRCVGVNAAGLMSKLTSLEVLLNKLKPSIFCVQETKIYRPGKIAIDEAKNYTIYELHRTNSRGGGLALGVLHQLQPVWIAEGDDDCEFIVVEVNVEQFKIRILTGYGPQVTSAIEKRTQFWAELEHQVKEAAVNDCAIILQFDGNLWLGNEMIKDDPNPMNSNGKLFKEFLDRNSNLHMVNGTEKCKGSITRQRITKQRNEESILDFFVVCDKIKPFIKEMKIDSEREVPLVTGKNVKSDHFTTYIDLDVSFQLNSEPRKEVFNFRNEDYQKIFKENTNHNKELVKSFDDDKTLEKQCNKWMKNLNNTIKNSFKKIRVTNKVKVSEESILLAEKLKLINDIKKNVGHKEDNEKKLEETERKLSILTSKKNRDKVINNFQQLDGSRGDSFTQGVWTLKKKIFPKNKPSLPIAKKDVNEKLVTTKHELKKLYLETFQFRLRDRPIKSEYENIKSLTDELCRLKLEKTANIKTDEWKIEDLDKALRQLKKNKSRDPMGLANEIFRPEVAGHDLKESLLTMFNKIKESTFLPEFFKEKNISAIPKGSGDVTNLEQERGIVIGSIFNNILMKLIYNQKYEIVDENMSESQVGSRKGKNIRNNNFMIYGIMNEAIQTKGGEVDVLVLDYKQCFDSLYTSSVTLDLYESGIKDNHLNLIHEADKSHFIGVNTPCGLTDRVEVKDSVLQGECLGPLKCSNSVDRIGKQCLEEQKNLYFYRNKTAVPPLGMVDDVICVSKCGADSVEMISYVNAMSNIMKLQLGTKKCHKMHIGKDKSKCPDLYIDSWKLEHKEEVITSVLDLEDVEDNQEKMQDSIKTRYLGETLSTNNSYDANIQARVARGIGAGKSILQILEETTFGPYETEVFVVLRRSLLLSTLLSNSETWYIVTKQHISELEKVDENLMRQKFELPAKIPKEFIYLETGLTPARFVMINRRLNFLHYLLRQDEKSIIYNFLMNQLENPLPNDWINLIRKDLIDLEIEIEIPEMREISSEEFKKIVNQKTENAAFKYLMTLKETHSKMSKLSYKKLEMKQHLKAEAKLTKNETNFIMNARSRSLNVKDNYKSAYKADELFCRGCLDKTLVESQAHLLYCEALNTNALSNIVTEERYEDLFCEDLEKLLKISRKLNDRYSLFRKLLENKPSAQSLAPNETLVADVAFVT